MYLSEDMGTIVSIARKSSKDFVLLPFLVGQYTQHQLVLKRNHKWWINIIFGYAMSVYRSIPYHYFLEIMGTDCLDKWLIGLLDIPVTDKNIEPTTLDPWFHQMPPDQILWIFWVFRFYHFKVEYTSTLPVIITPKVCDFEYMGYRLRKLHRTTI